MATNEKRLILRVPPATHAHFRIVAKQYCDGNLSEALRQALALYRQCWLQVREGFDIFLRSLEADGKYHVHHRVAVSAKCLPAPSAPKVPFKEIQATWTNEEMQAAQAMIDAGAARSRHDLAALAFGLLDHVRNQQSQGRQLSAIMDGQVKVLSDNWVVVEAAPPAVPGELYPPGTLLRTKDQRLNYEATRRRPNQIFLLTGLFDMGFDAPTNVVVSNNMLWHGSEYLVGINGGPGLQQEITRLRTAASQLAAGLPWSKFKNPEHLRKFRDLLDEVDPDDEIRLWCDPDNGEEHTSPVYLLLKYVVDPANCLAGRETDYNVPRPSWMFRTEHGVEGIFFTTENSRIVSGLVQYPEHLHRCSDLLQHLYLQARRLPTLDGGTTEPEPKPHTRRSTHAH